MVCVEGNYNTLGLMSQDLKGNNKLIVAQVFSKYETLLTLQIVQLNDFTNGRTE